KKITSVSVYPPEKCTMKRPKKSDVVHTVSETVASHEPPPFLANTFVTQQNVFSEKSTQMWTGNDKIFIRKRILSALLR
ncbi:hypothetical protein, partial [Escherichia coli]|uniref:hypothetical protein n=1 Tax=Escherichia coli TaxID=562 RepID=UPI0020235C77